ncbi:sensor histidine kinase [Paenibacillus alkalitolerans]|uniref:sensor histidine kinase n=1 Tax=Paenibacillus alkalitolerans TaxID=2799335 RepID=UPI0018F40B95|nr:ATP-binding protein [Paenibacillus alkalitolerans]
MNQQLPIILTTFAIGSLPQSFFFSYLGLMFWGYRISNTARKLFLFSFVQSAITVGAMYFIPVMSRPVLSLIVYVTVMILVLRSLRLIERVYMGLFVILLSMFNEIGLLYILSATGWVPYEQVLSDPRSIIWAANILPVTAAGLGYVMDRKSIHPGKIIFDFMKRKGNKYLNWLLLLFVFNITLSFFVYIFAAEDEQLAALIGMTLTMIVGLGIFLITVRAMAMTKEAAILSTQDAYIDDINNMFTAIRGQRHDFLNHVQVIQSLLQRGKYEELERYTKELVGEITEINELLQIGHPALAALVQSKMVSALNRKIDFRYSFEGMEQLKQGIASIDYVKIAGNLIDNALDEVAGRPAADRWVEVKGWVDADSFNMSVRNPSRNLTDEEMSLLFVPGYSTKQRTGHSGLGLSIVKERVDHYKGAVNVKSAPEHGTTFVVKIPIQLKNVATTQ